MRELLEQDGDVRRADACEDRMLEWSQRPSATIPRRWRWDPSGSGVGRGRGPDNARDTLLDDSPGLYAFHSMRGLQDVVVFISHKADRGVWASQQRGPLCAFNRLSLFRPAPAKIGICSPVLESHHRVRFCAYWSARRGRRDR